MNKLELQKQFALLCAKKQWVKILSFMKANSVDLNSIYTDSVYENNKDVIPCAYKNNLLAMSLINAMDAQYSKGKLTITAHKTIAKILAVAKLNQKTIDSVFFELLDYGKYDLILAVKELGLKCSDSNAVISQARRKAGMKIVHYAKKYRFFSVAALDSRSVKEFKQRIA